MLLAELARFTYTLDLLLFECWEFDEDYFRLHHFQFVEIDVANPLVPQLYVRIDFRGFCEHGRFHLVQIENEHPALSSSVRDDLALFFDEAPVLVESNLHPLLNHLADRDQTLCDSGYMQDSLNVGFLTFFAERNIADMPNRTRSVVSGFDIAGSLWRSYYAKPFFMRRHMV